VCVRPCRSFQPFRRKCIGSASTSHSLRCDFEVELIAYACQPSASPPFKMLSGDLRAKTISAVYGRHRRCASPFARYDPRFHRSS